MLKNFFSFVMSIFLLLMLNSCSAASLTKAIDILNANPLDQTFMTYNLLNMPTGYRAVPAGVFNKNGLQKKAYNSLFTNVTVFTNGYARVRFYQNGYRTTYVPSSVIFKNTNMNGWKTETANTNITLFSESALKNKITNLTKGTQYKVVYQTGQLKQVYVLGNVKYLGWIKSVKTEEPKLSFVTIAATEKRLGPGAAGTDSKDSNNTMPKMILTIQVGNPINNNMTTYSSLSAKQANGALKLSSISRMEANSVFGNIDFYDNGLAEVEYFDKSYNSKVAFIKISDITTANIGRVSTLAQVNAKKQYKLYAEEGLKNVIYEMAVGKTYKVLAQKGNLKQIYAYGKGQYSAIGWINDANYQKGILGDVNDDRVVNKNDLTVLDNYLDGKSGNLNLLNADLNDDGKVDVVDHNYLVLTINGNTAKKLFNVQATNPMVKSMSTYASLMASKPNGILNASDLSRIAGNSLLLDVDFYDNGLAKVSYFKGYKDYSTYIKSSDITKCTYLNTLNSKTPVVTNKLYDIYEDITFKRRIDTIPKGGTYKLLDASGVYKQVYYYGRGSHSVLGWIKESTGIKGDVDGNGKVDRNDLTVLTQYMTNKSMSIDLDNADMNGDGKITSIDVSKLSARFQPSQNFSVVYPANGLYSLQPMCAPNRELTVKNASTANNANVFIWSINSDWHTQLSHQKWYITRIGTSDWYKITAENSGKALNVHNGIAVNGTNVDIYPYGGKMHQFRFIDTGNGYYAIQANVGDLNVASYVLDVEGAGSIDGTNVSIHQFTNNSAQRWKLIKRASGLAVAVISNGWYKISPMHAPNKCLDVENGKDVNQANVQLWDWGNVNNQKFYLQNIGEGYFTLKTGCSSNRYIDVQWGNTTSGTNIWQYEKEATSNTAQKFRLLDAGNGYYYIEPKVKAGLAFDCAGGGSVNGTNVQLWNRESNNWYKWKFTKVIAPIVENKYVKLNVPYFKQNDNRWKNTKIGTKTIGQVGCLLTCLSMKHSYHTNQTITPDVMRNNVSFSNNDFKWASLNSFGYIKYDKNSKMTNSLMKEIYQALKNNKPVIVGHSSIHWVLVYGYSGNDTVNFDVTKFNIWDPATANRTNLKQFLDAKTSVIQRIIY